MLPQLGSVALQSGEHAGETIARRLEGKEAKPFKYNDKGTMATIGRGAAVVQMMHGRTIKGKTASLAWGTVHLALLPTNEDRAKAVVDWTWAGLTHQRAGRITVETDEERDMAGAGRRLRRHDVDPARAWGEEREMTRTATPSAARGPAAGDASDQRPADVLVIFGITGDLAKVMTFQLAVPARARGLLDCPIVGVAVDDWTSTA